MGIINVLDTQSANMIAAGEVVDRPASAVKELVENSIDAGAKIITVEIKNGGNIYLRVSDDGSGILREDLPKSLLRHATSKIKTGVEIDGVKTLGFRGEALAAIAAVSRLEIISKCPGDTFGSRLSSDETGVELYEAGSPGGTSIIVRDLFYNVPARRKFLKKDSTETAACGAVCEKLALSHPDVSITFIADGTQKLRTTGNGDLYSAIFDLYGSEISRGFIPVSYELDGISVEGYISRPDSPRGSRQMQNFFINGRYIKTKTVQAALEEAYKSYIPQGKFPAAVLMIGIDHKLVDVNVHPSKTEIKFSNEKSVFSAVYYAVKNALEPGITPAPAKEEQVNTTAFTSPFYSTEQDEKPQYKKDIPGYEIFQPDKGDDEDSPFGGKLSDHLILKSISNDEDNKTPAETYSEKPQLEIEDAKDGFRIIGEAYNTYIFVQYPQKIMIIDKHAAHERLIYEQLRTQRSMEVQELLTPVIVSLTGMEAASIINNAQYLESIGFTIEDFGGGTLAVRAVPAALGDLSDLPSIMQEFAEALSTGANLPFEDRCDKALYTIACKAALRAGDKSTLSDAEELVKRIMEQNLRYCPHGRPFIKEFTKKETGKFFDR